MKQSVRLRLDWVMFPIKAVPIKCSHQPFKAEEVGTSKKPEIKNAKDNGND